MKNIPKIRSIPYGRTKLMVENIMDDYDKFHGLKSVRLRYFNAASADGNRRIGEWHEPETYLIPNILKAALVRVRSSRCMVTTIQLVILPAFRIISM